MTEVTLRHDVMMMSGTLIRGGTAALIEGDRGSQRVLLDCPVGTTTARGRAWVDRGDVIFPEPQTCWARIMGPDWC